MASPFAFIPEQFRGAWSLLLTAFDYALDSHVDRWQFAVALSELQSSGATLADMAARFVPLSDALDGLNGALYSETGQHWQGEDLWRATRAIPIAERVQDPVGDSGLPPLYPK